MLKRKTLPIRQKRPWSAFWRTRTRWRPSLLGRGRCGTSANPTASGSWNLPAQALQNKKSSTLVKIWFKLFCHKTIAYVQTQIKWCPLDDWWWDLQNYTVLGFERCEVVNKWFSFRKMNWTQLLEHYLAVDNDGEVDERAYEAIGAIFGTFFNFF